MAQNNKDYSHVIAWIKESREARTKQTAYVNRAIEAYKGNPSRNRYARTIEQYAQSVGKHDTERAKTIREVYKDIPDKGSMVTHNAVETIVSMTMGGVGQYEFGPYDPNLKKDNTITDKLASFCKHWYIDNKIDAVMPRYIRAACLSGVSYLHLNRKNKRTNVTILDSSQMITDPKRFKLNYERYIGHAQRESLSAVKKSLTKTRGGYMLKTLNEAQVYVSQIRDMLNGTLTANPVGDSLNDNLRADLDLFYKDISSQIEENKKKDSNYKYEGDEIELTYLYDLIDDMEYQVVNRKYVISAKEKKFKKDIKCKYTDYSNPDKLKKKEITKTVEIDHPYVPLPFMETYWDRFPVSPLFYILDDFDDLCAMESVLYHNLSIMAPITFVGQSSDTEKVARVSSVAGEVVEGLPQTFATLAKTHDVTPVVTAIQRYEEKIKRVMNAVDPFELQAMIGDRATAKEVVATSGSVAQGMNPFIANIETAMSTLGEKAMKMEVIYGDEDVYSFTHNGQYAELSKQEIAGEYEIRARLASSIKLEQEAQARHAIELIGALGANEAINKQQFLGTLIPISMGGLVTKEQAKSMVSPEYRPLPDEVIASIRKRAEEDAKRDRADRMDLSNMSSEELMEATRQISDLTASTGIEVPVTAPTMNPSSQMIPAEQPVQDPMAGGIPPIALGTPEVAGEVFNDPTGQGYVL